MKTLMLAAAVALAAATATPAAAASFTIDLGPGASSADFGNTGETAGVIDDTYSFTVPAGFTSGFVGSIALTSLLDVDLTDVRLDDTPFTQVLSDGTELWTLQTTSISAGLHTIFVNGTWGEQGGSYAGTINFTPAVPEPSTWGLMIGGLGAAGGVLRRSRKPAALKPA